MNPEQSNARYARSADVEGMNLLNEPFAQNAAGHFYYASGDGAQRLDLLLHLAPYSPLLVVAGKPGVGKTALLRQFMTRAHDTWRLAVVTARVDMGREELLRDMAQGFGLPLDPRVEYQELYAALIAQLRALRQNAHVPILLLDDAQYLSATMMELIHKLCAENDNGHTLSILLFGTPQLQNLLDSPTLTSLAARVTHTFEVTPLGEEETGDYIRHRLRAAGSADDGPFDAVMINRIYAASGGIPAKINELAQRALSDKPLDDERRSLRKAPSGSGSGKRLVMLVLVAALAAVIVAGPLRTALFKPAPPASPVARVTQPSLPASPKPTGEERVLRAQDQSQNAPATEAVKTLPLPPVAETKPPMETVPAKMPSKAPAQTAKSEPAQEASDSSSKSTVTPEPPESPVVAEPAVAKAEPTKPVVAPPRRRPEPATPVSPKPKVAKLEPVKPVAPKPTTQSKGGFLGAAWVKAQSGDHFTLQLMALKEEATARQFIELHQLQKQAAYVPVRHDGQVLYALLYGSYPSRVEAARAAKALPAKWGVPNPWIRSFKGLHGELDR